MELIKTTDYEFTPVATWCLTNCYLPDGVQKQHYDTIMTAGNTSLTTEQQQYYWFGSCFKNLRDNIVNKGKCTVRFNVYTCPYSLYPKEDGKHITLSSNGYTLFINMFRKRPYNQLQEYHVGIGEITKFHYTWWLYCLSEDEKQYFHNQEVNDKKVCVLEMLVL